MVINAFATGDVMLSLVICFLGDDRSRMESAEAGECVASRLAARG